MYKFMNFCNLMRKTRKNTGLHVCQKVDFGSDLCELWLSWHHQKRWTHNYWYINISAENEGTAIESFSPLEWIIFSKLFISPPCPKVFQFGNVVFCFIFMFRLGWRMHDNESGWNSQTHYPICKGLWITWFSSLGISFHLQIAILS